LSLDQRLVLFVELPQPLLCLRQNMRLDEVLELLALLGSFTA
jgi:hypothetical protein